MSGIVQFLNERLAEDEARLLDGPFSVNEARAVFELDRKFTTGTIHDLDCEHVGCTDGRCMCGASACTCGAHDRLLRDVRAKRELLTYAFKEAARRDAEWGCVHSAEDIRAGRCPDEEPDGLFILRALAAPYASHPDFNREWWPE